MEEPVPLFRGCFYPGKNCSFPGKKMFQPAWLQILKQQRRDSCIPHIDRLRKRDIWKYQYHDQFFFKISTKFDIGFFEITKCNFRRHFSGCLVKNIDLKCLECFWIALPQQRLLNKWNRCSLPHRVGQTSFLSGILPRATPSVSIPLWNLFLPSRLVKNTRFHFFGAVLPGIRTVLSRCKSSFPLDF